MNIIINNSIALLKYNFIIYIYKYRILKRIWKFLNESRNKNIFLWHKGQNVFYRVFSGQDTFL